MTISEIVVRALWCLGLLFLAYLVGHSKAHEELLDQCKGPERGIYLNAYGKRYFYYCSYVPQKDGQ